MKSLLHSSVLLSVTLLLWAAPAAFAAEGSDQSAANEKAKAAYPLATCVVSGDKLNEMGKPIEYVYKQAGKPDRLVLFCCKDCIKDFEGDPAKYLKKIDEAAAAKAKAGPADKH